MVISSSPGLRVTVPNDQFMVPSVTIDRNGRHIFNESQREFLFSPAQDPVHMPTLGRYFLTSAHLLVDQDAGTFTFWQANPSNASPLVLVPGDKKKRGNGDDDCGTRELSLSSARGSVGKRDDSSPGIPYSARIGISLAIVIIVSVVAKFVYWNIKERRKEAEAERSALVEQIISRNRVTVVQRPTPVHEMHAESRPAEVQGSEVVYELEGRTVR
jgi:hypothetical protein